MKKVAGLVAVAVAVAVAAVGVGVRGAPVESVREWALKNGAEGVAGRLAAAGITNAADQAAIQAGWEEDVIVEAALRAKAYRLLADQAGLARLSEANRRRVKESLAAEDPAPRYALTVVRAFGAAERGEFRRMLEAHYRDLYAAQPAMMRLQLEHGVERDFSFADPALDVADLVELLLAPLLGKIAVALGPEGYNAFVDEYNNGKAP